jgi:hypothetical protein
MLLRMWRHRTSPYVSTCDIPPHQLDVDTFYRPLGSQDLWEWLTSTHFGTLRSYFVHPTSLCSVHGFTDWDACTKLCVRVLAFERGWHWNRCRLPSAAKVAARRWSVSSWWTPRPSPASAIFVDQEPVAENGALSARYTRSIKPDQMAMLGTQLRVIISLV